MKFYSKTFLYAGLSILQNGNIPEFMDEAALQQIFISCIAPNDEYDNRTPISELRKGMKEM